MAYKFYEIQIGTIHLTQTGEAKTAENLSCKLALEGVNRLRSNYKRVRLPDSIDGDPIFQTFEIGDKGKTLIISIGILLSDVLTQLIALIEDLSETGNSVNIIGTGATGNFNLNFVPDEDPYNFGEFRGTRVKNVVLRFVSV